MDASYSEFPHEIICYVSNREKAPKNVISLLKNREKNTCKTSKQRI